LKPASNNSQRLQVAVAGDEGSARLDRVLAVRLQAVPLAVGAGLASSVTVGSAPIRDPAYHVTAGRYVTIDVPDAVLPSRQREYRARYRLGMTTSSSSTSRGLVVIPPPAMRPALVNALIAIAG
jgi:23S rRNA pseudouridine1911/1915/1917 synthase